MDLDRVKERVATAERVVVLTGAGVSAESGVPTFRGGGGTAVWRGMAATDLSSAMDHDTAPGSDCSNHPDGSRDKSGPPCCGMGACHAVEMTVAPDVSSPVTAAVPLAIVGDGQVDGVIPGRLDRPPRTV